jgi:hypothetical protein
MTEHIIPMAVWGYIGIVFTGLLFTIAVWSMAWALHKKEDINDHIMIALIFITVGLMVLIGSLWQFELIL